MSSDYRLQICWSSRDAYHRDQVFLPAREGETLLHVLGASCPGKGTLPEQVIAPWRREGVIEVERAALPRGLYAGTAFAVRPGRWYPARLLERTGMVLPSGARVCRCLAADNGLLRFDCNHPLGAFTPRYELHAHGENAGLANTSTDALSWRHWLDAGPGIQARHADVAADFFGNEALRRDDSDDDRHFYAMPRLVHHIDSAASAQIQTLYESLIPPGARVLDLMSSWVSHLPDSLELSRVEGLGMNAIELSRNPRLDAYHVHDLNRNPALPVADAHFDVVICNLSIEYLVRAHAVVHEVARVLEPGGVFVCTFSNRWFPPKAIRIWASLHEFERVALVQTLLLESHMFDDVTSWSSAGLPRPHDDPYRDRLALSDPMYAVWGTRRG